LTDTEVPQHDEHRAATFSVGPDTTTRPRKQQQQRRVRRRTVSSDASASTGSNGSRVGEEPVRPTSIAFLLNDASTEEDDYAALGYSSVFLFSSPASSPSTNEPQHHQAATIGRPATPAAAFPFPCHFVLSG
jgi:hypothetical protein